MLVLAAGVVTGLTVFGHESAAQRQHSQADALAQQQEAQLRGEQLSQLSTLIAAGSSGVSVTPAPVYDGTTYTITNKAQYVAASGSAGQCSSSSSADYIRTTTTVNWTNNAGSPITEEALIAAVAGSSLVVQVQDQNGVGVSGMSINATGTDANTSGTNTTLTTDSNGCAIFYGLTVGTYTVTATGPQGDNYIDKSGDSSPTADETLLAGETTNAVFVMARAGSITPTFVALAANGTQTPVSSYGGNGTTAWFLSNTGMVPSTIAETSSPASSLFPFTSSYTAYAGPCSSDGLSPTTLVLGANQNATPNLYLPFIYLATLTNPHTAALTSTLASIKLNDAGCTADNYPAQAANVTNSAVTTSTNTESEALPAGVYSACAQWVVASSGTTTYTTTSTSLSTSTTTSTTTTGGWTNEGYPYGWVSNTHGTSTTTLTSTFTSTLTSTVTTSTTVSATSAAATSNVTNTTSASTPQATLNQATATSGTCP